MFCYLTHVMQCVCAFNLYFLSDCHDVCLYPTAACNFIYLNAVLTEMLTGPCAVQKAVSSTLDNAPSSFTLTVVNLKVSLKGVTLTDINRK